MILIGYQGIGKSSISNPDTSCIDLESGNMWVDGVRADDWYKPYCSMAVHLSEQGYTVFTSSHEVVRNQLRDMGASDVMIICPSPKLKEQWLQRLQERYDSTQSEKDSKALLNAQDRYTENIQELIDDPDFDVYLIENIDYDLADVVEDLITSDGFDGFPEIPKKGA
jgi:hypothetical protein